MHRATHLAPCFLVPSSAALPSPRPSPASSPPPPPPPAAAAAAAGSRASCSSSPSFSSISPTVKPRSHRHRALQCTNRKDILRAIEKTLNGVECNKSTLYALQMQLASLLSAAHAISTFDGCENASCTQQGDSQSQSGIPSDTPMDLFYIHDSDSHDCNELTRLHSVD